jgi:hypothetical protein
MGQIHLAQHRDHGNEPWDFIMGKELVDELTKKNKNVRDLCSHK